MQSDELLGEEKVIVMIGRNGVEIGNVGEWVSRSVFVCGM